MSTKMELFLMFMVSVMCVIFLSPIISCNPRIIELPDNKPSDRTVDFYPVCIEGYEFYENCYYCGSGRTINHLDDNGKPVKCGKDIVERKVLRK